VLYAGTQSAGVFKSYDGGAHWERFGDGLTNLDVRALALSLGVPHVPYAATAGGVFKIVDDTPEFTLGSTQYCVGATWKVMITNSAPNAWVRLLGTTADQAWEIPEWGKTDDAGTLSVEGRFAEGTEGSYTLRAEIGGLISNRLAVVVSGCRGARRR